MNTARIWQQRAEQARRFAGMLSWRDAKVLQDYADECEQRADCLTSSRASGAKRCETCPFDGEPCDPAWA